MSRDTSKLKVFHLSDELIRSVRSYCPCSGTRSPGREGRRLGYSKSQT